MEISATFFFLSESPLVVGGDFFRSIDAGSVGTDVGAGEDDFSSGEVVFGMLTLIFALPG